MRPFGILCSFDLAGRGGFGTPVVAARRRFSSLLGLGGDLSALMVGTLTRSAVGLATSSAGRER